MREVNMVISKMLSAGRSLDEALNGWMKQIARSDMFGNECEYSDGLVACESGKCLYREFKTSRREAM